MKAPKENNDAALIPRPLMNPRKKLFVPKKTPAKKLGKIRNLRGFGVPNPTERTFDNGHQEKPKRKVAELKVTFGELTDKNYEQLRVLNYTNLPVIYSENFY